MKYGVIGEHLKHSFSKEIHSKIADYVYEIKEISPEKVEGFIKEKDFCGINVTIPYKETVMPYLDFISDDAKKIGAVNTVVNRDGKLFGYNTDYIGMRALIIKAYGEIKGKKVLILGAGGTSKTAHAVISDMDPKNEILKVVREKQDGMITVGRNPVSELLKSGRDIEKIYVLRGEREGSITKIVAIARERGIVVDETDKKRLDELSAGANHQGVAAIASPVEYVSVASMVEKARERGEKPLIVVCDGIEDPHNLGAIIRCADGAGAHGVIIGKRRCAQMTSTVIKSSAGAIEYVSIAKVANIAAAIDELKEMGVWTFAAEADGEDCRSADFNCPCAIVLGSEGEGVSRLVREKCDYTVSIPMRGGVNSLNVSTAAAVLLYEAANKQGK